MTFLYLLGLLISIFGIATLDFKYKLAFAVDFARAATTIAIGVVFFLIWDLFGIALGIFFRGNAQHLTGITLAPELPLEEVFFLILLCYSTLAIFTAAAKKLGGDK